MVEKALHNRTVKYVLDQLSDVETEMRASQSSMLASGFLEFDAGRFESELLAMIETIKNEKPIDYPETHPHPVEPVTD